jgi:hypothetical protein
MMDTQGFTAEVETMYNSHVLALGPVDNIPHRKAGGLARVSDALENFELTRPWLDSMR